jgi:hypothetical protein
MTAVGIIAGFTLAAVGAPLWVFLVSANGWRCASACSTPDVTGASTAERLPLLPRRG